MSAATPTGVPKGPKTARPAAGDMSPGDLWLVTNAGPSGDRYMLTEVNSAGDAWTTADMEVQNLYSESFNTEKGYITDDFRSIEAESFRHRIVNAAGMQAFSSTSGSGSTSRNITQGVRTSTGYTADSDATWNDKVDENPTNPFDWGKDRFVRFGTQIANFSEVGYLGTGSFGVGARTEQHIGFVAENGDLVGSVADGSTESTVTLVSGASTGTYDLLATLVDGVATFYVGGVEQGTIETNLPTGSANANIVWRQYAENPGGTDLSIDSNLIEVHQGP